jgi:hypothetical protein
MSHVWMEHGEHGGRAQLPDIPFWRAQGWSPCDGPPPEPDMLHDPAPEPEETTDAPPSAGLLAVHEAGEPADTEEE